jgi:hypothetical protein
LFPAADDASDVLERLVTPDIGGEAGRDQLGGRATGLKIVVCMKEPAPHAVVKPRRTDYGRVESD